MVQDEAFGGPDAPIHHAGLFNPVWAMLFVAALVAVWAITQFLLPSFTRANRRAQIYDAVKRKADAAAAAPVTFAVEKVIVLKNEINAQLGKLIVGGELSGLVGGMVDAMAKPPKPASDASAIVLGEHQELQVSRTLTVRQGGVAPDSGGAGDLPLLSANERAQQTAQKFKVYWDKRADRLREIEDAQSRLCG